MAKLLNIFCKLPQNSGQISPQKETHTNSRVILGRLKKYESRYRRLFELSLPENTTKSSFLFPALQPALSTCKIRNESQPFPQWKVQRDFQKLRVKQRKRLKQKKIYVLPIGPFPDLVTMKFGGLNLSLFELLCEFLSAYYLGFEVLLKDVVNLDDLSCTTRIHAGTGKRQVLVKDVLLYLQQSLPSDAFAIIGITWEDMYPGDEWNFALGEASSIDGCAAMCFGHYEPNESQRIYHQNETEINRVVSVNSSQNEQHCCKEEERNCVLQSYLENSALKICPVEIDEGKDKCKDCSGNYQGRSGEERNCGDLECEACVQNTATLKTCGSEKIDKIDAFQIWKLFRVISHELGHVFGLAHCVYFSCAMNESTSVHEAVNQPLFMCPICLKKIQVAVGFDIYERYHQLKNFLEMVHSGLLESECLMEKEHKSSDLLELEQKCCDWLEKEQKSSNLLERKHKQSGLLEMVPITSGDFLDIIDESKGSECGSSGKTLAKDTSVVTDSLEKLIGAIRWLQSMLKFLDNDGVD